jgi:spermidine/putrescine-binding protein
VGATLTALPRAARSAGEKKLNVYNWDTYIGETTLATVTERLGIEVQYDLYANLDDLFAKFKTGNPGYDVIFPNDYMIETMIKPDMLEPIDHVRLVTWKHIDENFRDPAFDPGDKHNVPYFWGTVGFDHLHDPRVNAEIANTIRYATSNKAAREFVDPKDLANPAVYPPDDIVARCEGLIDVGARLRLYDEAWTAIRAA